MAHTCWHIPMHSHTYTQFVCQHRRGGGRNNLEGTLGTFNPAAQLYWYPAALQSHSPNWLPSFVAGLGVNIPGLGEDLSEVCNIRTFAGVFTKILSYPSVGASRHTSMPPSPNFYDARMQITKNIERFKHNGHYLINAPTPVLTRMVAFRRLWASRTFTSGSTRSY